jgi:hypothetical protein
MSFLEACNTIKPGPSLRTSNGISYLFTLHFLVYSGSSHTSVRLHRRRGSERALLYEGGAAWSNGYFRLYIERRWGNSRTRPWGTWKGVESLFSLFQERRARDDNLITAHDDAILSQMGAGTLSE